MKSRNFRVTVGTFIPPRPAGSQTDTHTQAEKKTMAKKAIQKNQIVKLIVGAGQATPSPPIGPALGSKGVKSMDFCKVFYSPPLVTHCRTLNKGIVLNRLDEYRNSMHAPRT